MCPLSLHYDSRKTGVILSLHSRKTGGPEGCNAHEQCPCTPTVVRLECSCLFDSRTTGSRLEGRNARGQCPCTPAGTVAVVRLKCSSLNSHTTGRMEKGVKPGTEYPCTSTVVRLECFCLSTVIRLEDWKGVTPVNSVPARRQS